MPSDMSLVTGLVSVWARGLARGLAPEVDISEVLVVVTRVNIRHFAAAPALQGVQAD